MNKKIAITLMIMLIAVIPLAVLFDGNSEASVSGSGTQNDPYTDVDIDATSVHQYFSGNNKYVRAGTVFNITEYDDGYIVTWVSDVTSGHGLYVDNNDFALKGTLTGSGTVTIEVSNSDGVDTSTATYTFTIVSVSTYSITFRSSDGGSVSPSYILSKPSGTAIQISGNRLTIADETAVATANAGYEFDHWELSNGNPVPSTLTQPLMIKAYFVQSAPKYTVTITAGTGGSVSSGSISNISSGTAISVSGNTITINGTTVTATASSNYSFYNWTKSDGTSIPSTVTGDITIRANFQTTYVITYNDNGGSGGPGTQSYGPTTDASHSFQVPSLTPTRNGYRFWGWATTSSGYTSKYPGDTITLNGPYVTTTYYAIWIQYNFTLQFSANGGTGAPNSQNTGNIGSYYYDIRIPYDTPTREGRTFLGWSTNSSSAVADYYPGGTYHMEITVGGSSNPRTYSSTEMLYAVWETPITYSYVLVYNPNGGSGGPPNDTQSNIVDSTYTFTTSMVQPTWAGYTFLGWANDPASTTPDYDAGTQNSIVVSGVPNDTVTTTLYAVWTSSYRYHLVTDFNGGEYSEQASSDFYYPGENTWTTDSSHTFSLSMIPTKQGYSFIGWADSSSATVSQYINSIELQGVPTQQLDKTIYAVWSQDPYIYTLDYNVNMGINGPEDETYSSSSTSHTFTVSDIEPIRSGYTFLGWGDNIGTAVYQAGDSITINEAGVIYNTKTIYAVWQAITTTYYSYEISYNANGGTGAPPTGYEYNRNESSISYTLSATVPTRANYTFIAWTIGYDEYDPGDTITINGTANDIEYVILYAKWSARYSYTLVYDANGGFGGPENDTAINQTSDTYTFTVSSIEPSRIGCTFLGWTEDDLSQVIDYRAGDPIQLEGVASQMVTKTIYAVWEGSMVDYTYWSNGEFNGSVSILYHMDIPATTNYDITENINLYYYNGEEFELTPYIVSIHAYNERSSGSYTSKITATLNSEALIIESGMVDLGKWANFIVTIDATNKEITYTKVNNFASFQSYGTREGGTIIPLSTGLNDMVVREIGFETNNTAPRQEVVKTMVFLNTYGVVMTDPTFDIDDYWPSQTNIRFAMFSFALYGDTITFNGQTFDVVKPNIIVEYIVKDNKNELYLYTYQSTSDLGVVSNHVVTVNGDYIMSSSEVKSKKLVLTDLYVTWQDGHCYLTFNQANDWQVDLGPYTNREISATGLWYFQSGMYESYQETESYVTKDWRSFNFDFRVFGVIALGLLVLAGVVMRMMTDAKLGDYLILFGAIGVIITMVGGML